MAVRKAKNKIRKLQKGQIISDLFYVLYILKETRALLKKTFVAFTVSPMAPNNKNWILYLVENLF